MTIRGVGLGLLLGFFISLATYFNDWVIGQTQLIGNQLPISVFGFVTVLVLVLNPLLSKMSERLPFKPSEIAMVAVIGLSACGWPGSNFYRGFTTGAAFPAHWLRTRADWQATQVMSYVPGGSAELGQGHVRDWRRLTANLLKDGANPGDGPVKKLWLALTPVEQRTFSEAEQNGFQADNIEQMTHALNRVLREVDLYSPQAIPSSKIPEAAKRFIERKSKSRLKEHELAEQNRWLLVAALPEIVVPPPEGRGVLLNRGRADPFLLDTLIQGTMEGHRLRLTALPWAAWWPTISLWGGVAMALAFCAMCLAFIVHPQWSKRELLPYPVARFVEELAERASDSALPVVAKSRLFWLGVAIPVLLHSSRGLHAWFEGFPEIPNWMNFYPLWSLFPNATRIEASAAFLGPVIYPSVIAFSFFLQTSVSFSLGISALLFVMMGSALLANGYSLEADLMFARQENMLRFGAYLAFAIIILYIGRRYYREVVLSALGRRRGQEAPEYATWAARGLGLAMIIAVALLHGAGLGWLYCILFVLLMLVIFLVMARMVTETGVFFIQPWWSPVGVIAGFMGFNALGPTAFATLAIASAILICDPREIVMPFISNGLFVSERAGAIVPNKVAPWIAIMLVGGFVAAGAMTLWLQYNYSASQMGNTWGTDDVPQLAFNPLSRNLADAAAHGTLADATAAGFWQRLLAIHPPAGNLLWFSIGLILVLVTSVARLRLPWWPLHPVAFLVWGTYPGWEFAFSFLLGSGIKASVVGISGTKGYHSVKPLMVGVIAGELLMGLFWMLVCAAYFFIEHKRPVNFMIFPA